ncbi:hypothetical protein IFR05_005474 [Cadophora sp. M221]|nr:hypothetical protein IFR05_005474 [Cadophora sp. M221]
MGEGPASLSCAFYSARLLWKVAGRTRVILSVLKSNRSLRRKVSKVSIVENENGGFFQDRDDSFEKDYFSVTPPATERRQSSCSGKKSCHLCKIKYKKIDRKETSPPPCSPETRRPNSSNTTYLPITRTQPPKPPLRTSSLPFFKQLRRLALTTNPTPPLSHFRFTQRDGASFQWLVLAHAEKHGLHEFMDPIWDLLPQVCHVEPCVRHAVLAVAALRQKFHYGSNSWDSLCSHTQRHITRHYISAIRGLHDRLAGIRGGANAPAWEVSFVASYLFTVLQFALQNKTGAYFWLKAGYRILKHAFRVFGVEIYGRTLSATMRDVARAFGRLDTRSIKTLRTK